MKGLSGLYFTLFLGSITQGSDLFKTNEVSDAHTGCRFLDSATLQEVLAELREMFSSVS